MLLLPTKVWTLKKKDFGCISNLLLIQIICHEGLHICKETSPIKQISGICFLYGTNQKNWVWHTIRRGLKDPQWITRYSLKKHSETKATTMSVWKLVEFPHTFHEIGNLHLECMLPFTNSENILLGHNLWLMQTRNYPNMFSLYVISSALFQVSTEFVKDGFKK